MKGNGKLDSVEEAFFTKFCNDLYDMYLQVCTLKDLMACDYDEWFSNNFAHLNNLYNKTVLNGDKHE